MKLKICKVTSLDNSLLDNDSPDKVGNAITQVETPLLLLRSVKSLAPRHELIQYRLHEGQKILVQVTKDQLGTKGASYHQHLFAISLFGLFAF